MNLFLKFDIHDLFHALRVIVEDAVYALFLADKGGQVFVPLVLEHLGGLASGDGRLLEGILPEAVLFVIVIDLPGLKLYTRFLGRADSGLLVGVPTFYSDLGLLFLL